MFFATLPTRSVLNGVWFWGAGSDFKPRSLRLYADSSWFPIASLVSTGARLYDENTHLSASDLLLLEQHSELLESHKALLKRLKTHWYWNDCQYFTGQQHWFQRLRRFFLHAH
jgi:hypothetical protein